MRALQSAPWPGNVRELRNVIEHLVVMAAPGAALTSDDIVFVDDDAFSESHGGASYGPDTLNLEYHAARDQVLARFEVDYVTHIVQSAAGNISDAARLAGVDRTTLYRLMDKHGLGRRELRQADSGAD
jgi:DNA-binding NtrC family response regulator